MDKRRNVVITGANGFIGSRLVEDLSKHNWNVFALTSRPEKLAKNIVGIKCNWTIDDIKRTINQLPKISFWIHTAAKVDLTESDTLQLYFQNSLMTQLIADYLNNNRLSFLIFFSSISVYNKTQEITLDSEPIPDTHYGLSKLLGEKYCQNLLGKRCSIIRLAGVWGDEQNPKLFVNRCLQNAKIGKTIKLKSINMSKRNYLWVEDISGIVTYVYNKRLSGIQIAAGPEAISIYDMVDAIGKEFGVSVLAGKKNISDRDIIAKSSLGIPTTEFNKSLFYEAHKNI